MADATVVISIDDVIGTIHPNLYGHFAEHLGRCIYEGIWVGRQSRIAHQQGLRLDTLRALRAIRAPVVRWPGGCFADFYHWKDGIGPVGRRPRRLNIWWDQEESNAFGTDEFLRFCARVGCEPYICVNVGTGSPQEAAEWLEYCNGTGRTAWTARRARHGRRPPYGVKYWGVGNENWGCGGRFDPDDYARRYRQFACFLRRVDPSVELIACGHHSDNDWNLRVMETLRNHLDLVDHLSVHRYFSGHGRDVEFTDKEYIDLLADTLVLERDLEKTADVIDYFAGDRKAIGIVLDEWGVWHVQTPQQRRGLQQQNTLRDAISAATVLNLLNRWCRRVVMANIAQTVNVLQCLILTDGPRMVLTPTYHVFAMFVPHGGSECLHTRVEGPALPVAVGRTPLAREMACVDASASRAPGGRLAVTLVNRSLDRDLEVRLELRGPARLGPARLTLLHAPDVRDHNDFDDPGRVRPRSRRLPAPAGGPLVVSLPRHAVAAVEARLV